MEVFHLKRAATRGQLERRRLRPRDGRTGRSPRAIFLVGFMGAGKTCVGQALAARLGARFLDLDERIEARHQRRIADIFRDDGEKQFRRLETEELRQVVAELQAESESAAVVALGGGTFVQPANTSLLGACGYTVFLDAPVEELWQRAQAAAGTRPLALSENHFRQLYAQRRSRYMEADHHVQTGGRQMDEVAAEIAALFFDPGQGDSR